MKTPIQYKIVLISMLTLTSCARMGFGEVSLKSPPLETEEKLLKLNGTVESSYMIESTSGPLEMASAAQMAIEANPPSTQNSKIASKAVGRVENPIANHLKLSTGQIIVCDISDPSAPQVLHKETVILTEDKTELKKSPRGVLTPRKEKSMDDEDTGLRASTGTSLDSMLDGLQLAGGQKRSALRATIGASAAPLQQSTTLRVESILYTYSVNLNQKTSSNKNIYVAFKEESNSKVLNDAVTCPAVVNQSLEYNDDLGHVLKFTQEELDSSQASLNLDSESTLNSRLILSLEEPMLKEVYFARVNAERLPVQNEEANVSDELFQYSRDLIKPLRMESHLNLEYATLKSNYALDSVEVIKFDKLTARSQKNLDVVNAISVAAKNPARNAKKSKALSNQLADLREEKVNVKKHANAEIRDEKNKIAELYERIESLKKNWDPESSDVFLERERVQAAIANLESVSELNSDEEIELAALYDNLNMLQTALDAEIQTMYETEAAPYLASIKENEDAIQTKQQERKAQVDLVDESIAAKHIELAHFGVVDEKYINTLNSSIENDLSVIEKFDARIKILVDFETKSNQYKQQLRAISSLAISIAAKNLEYASLSQQKDIKQEILDACNVKIDALKNLLEIKNGELSHIDFNVTEGVHAKE